MTATLLTAATDILVIAGVAAVATAALSSKDAPFKTSLGAEYDDNSLVASEINDAVGSLENCQSPFGKLADGDKKMLTVNVDTVAVTPPLLETQESDLIARAEAIHMPNHQLSTTTAAFAIQPACIPALGAQTQNTIINQSGSKLL